MTHNESLYLFVKNPRTASLRLKALDSHTSKGTGTGVDHVIGAGAIAVKDLQVGGWVFRCLCVYVCVLLSVRGCLPCLNNCYRMSSAVTSAFVRATRVSYEHGLYDILICI